MSGNKNIEFVLIACLTFAVALAAQSKADNLYYQVFRSQSEDPATAEVIAARVSDTHFTDPDVEKGIRYYYWVKATSMVADFNVISRPVLTGDPEVYPHYKSTLYLLVADKTKVGQLTPLIIMHEMENLTQDIHSIDFDYYFYRTDSGTEQLDHVSIENITIQPVNTFYKELNHFYIIPEYDTEPVTFQGSVQWQYDHYTKHYDFTQLTPEINSELVYVLPAGPTVTTQPTENNIEITWTAKTETTDRSEAALGRIPTTVYVNHAGTPDPEDGKTWETAYIFLQDAVQHAEYGDTIYVADPSPGKYYPDVNSATPTGSNDRTATFNIPNGVRIYGGFPTHGGDLSQRNPSLHITTLSGDIQTLGDITDNCYHVVTASNCDANTVLDGFIIEAGFANMSDPDNKGAGIYMESSDAIIKNCTIASNAAEMAAGVYCKQNAPAIVNCLIRNNYAAIFGGAGLYNENSATTVLNSRFMLNFSDVNLEGDGGNGGSVYNESSDPVMINCEFKCNTAKKNGGGVYNWDSEPEVINCTFSGNIADVNGGGMCNSDMPGYFSIATIENCIFWGNSDGNATNDEYSQIAGYESVIYNSCIQDEAVNDGNLPFSGAPNHNIDKNPQFVATPNTGPDGQWNTADDCIGDLMLQYSSPCIEVGNNFYLPADSFDIDQDNNIYELISLDAAGHNRLIDRDKNLIATVDMGAFERGVCPGNPDLDDSNRVDFIDFAMFVEKWKQADCDCYDLCCDGTDLNGDETVDIYDLHIIAQAWLTNPEPADNPQIKYWSENGHYYERVEVTLTWIEAKVAAEARIYKGIQGHLAAVTSQEENDFLMNNVIGNQGAYFLGGFQPEGTVEPPYDNNWQWVTGEIWNWNNWNSGEPNNGYVTHEEYLIIYGYGDTHGWQGKWGDAPYFTQLHYIVEYE